MVHARFRGPDWHTVPALGGSFPGRRVDPDELVEFPGDVVEETDDAYVVGVEGGEPVALPKSQWSVEQGAPKRQRKPAAAGDEG